ncbi:hypothetical protein GCM10023094_18320 [Rhodococcus olei]|uniref:non-specific serine/threonine protein kinase n=1 Tax=Rhodococcus olei TaxID=2161675 RepID=A0ABP8NXC7_9NOCA
MRPGSLFAGYRIERLLGAGGMGSVYLARHPSLPRLVALKLPDPALTSDPQGRDRFLREADHAALLDHPNIVTVYDRGAERDPRGGAEQLWISMQYVDGTDAATPLRQGPMPVDRAVRIVGDIARALDHAHAHGVLHRDVKPANILLTVPRAGEPERALLADFGIAKGLESTSLTRTGTVVASLQYASPEQIEGRPLDGRSDQYALGATLCHLLIGHPPFPDTDPAYLVHAHLNLPAPRVTAARPDLPPALDAVLARALAKNPPDRFPSSAALAAAARSALEGPRAGAPGTPSPTTHLATPLPTETVGASAPPPPPPPRRRLLVPVAAGAAAAALAGAAVTAWLLGDSGDTAGSAPVATSNAAPPPTHTETVVVPAPTTQRPTLPPTTTQPPTSGKKVPPGRAPGRTVGYVSGADEQGFTDGDGPRCNHTNPAVAVARTEESAIVVCQAGVGRYYYIGQGSSDTAEIELDDPKRSGDGFTATNGSVKYVLDSDALTITDDGDLVAREDVLEYRFGG